MYERCAERVLKKHPGPRATAPSYLPTYTCPARRTETALGMRGVNSNRHLPSVEWSPFPSPSPLPQSSKHLSLVAAGETSSRLQPDCCLAALQTVPRYI